MIMTRYEVTVMGSAEDTLRSEVYYSAATLLDGLDRLERGAAGASQIRVRANGRPLLTINLPRRL
jgi:hypothetical protein